ncbi:MAG: hypothetical protein F6K03_18045 [Kamptonema sp. SIO4C4]|nr:hypothetical protein [Kamptonema sp. SIO4C4]
MFQEFQLSVTPLGGDRYFIRTEKVASGVPLAEEQVQWNTAEWRDRASQLMADPLFNVMQGGDSLEADFRFITGELNQGTTEAATFNLIEFGQHLYEALFQGTLRDSWIAAQSIAHNQRSILRLRLGMRGSELLRLPWEVLHSREGSSLFRPLATGTDVAFSRYLIGSPLGSPTLNVVRSPQQPLRILMAIAQPDDQDILALQKEAYHPPRAPARRATRRTRPLTTPDPSSMRPDQRSTGPDQRSIRRAHRPTPPAEPPARRGHGPKREDQRPTPILRPWH